MLNPVLMLLAGVGIGGTVGVFAMSLADASKVEPPPLLKDKNMMNQNEAEKTAKSDED